MFPTPKFFISMISKVTFVMKNDQPFQDPKIANHFGDIDVYNGEIYCGIEKFEYGRGYNIARVNL